MPSEENDSADLCSFVLMDGNAFSAGSAVSTNGLIAIDHFVHIPGKEFGDSANDLKTHVKKKDALVQISCGVTLLDAESCANAQEMAAKLTRASGLTSDNLLVAYFDRTTGAPLAPAKSRKNAIAFAVNKSAIYGKRDEAKSLGATEASLTVRVINTIGAIKDALREGAVTGPVLCVSILKSSCQLISVSEDSIDDLGSIDVGYTNLHLQIMTELGLKFEGSAARLFLGNIYDFEDKGNILAGPFSLKIKNRLDAYVGRKPTGLVLCGLPPIRTDLLVRHIAPATNLAPVKLPSPFVATSPTSAALPVVATPELGQMLTMRKLGKGTHGSFLADFAKVHAEFEKSWETISTENAGFIRMYRGMAVDENGNPVDIHPHHETHKHDHDAPVRKIARMYRGNPIYEDELTTDVAAANTAGTTPSATSTTPAESAPAPAKAPTPAEPRHERKIIGMYRGSPIYEDEQAAPATPPKVDIPTPIATVKSAPAPVKEPEPVAAEPKHERKIVRMYRGTPIYEDEL